MSFQKTGNQKSDPNACDWSRGRASRRSWAHLYLSPRLVFYVVYIPIGMLLGPPVDPISVPPNPLSESIDESSDQSEYYSDSSASQYSLDSAGHFVRCKSKRKMEDSRFESVDAARYSARHKAWRRTSKSAKILPGSPLPSTLKIITWNIDFSTPNVKTRLKTALMHIQHDVLKCKGGERPHPCVILLQEIHRVRRMSPIVAAILILISGRIPSHLR